MIEMTMFLIWLVGVGVAWPLFGVAATRSAQFKVDAWDRVFISFAALLTAIGWPLSLPIVLMAMVIRRFAK